MPTNSTRSTGAAAGTVAAMMRIPPKARRPAADPPCPYVLENQLIGVELEYEQATRMAQRILDPNQSSGYWNVTADGSLRNHGEEFVLREGLEGLELAYAIHEFFTLAQGAGLVENGRTSCHIHLDMRDAHVELLRATVLVYQAVEQMFWSMVHRQRQWTGYCIPLLESQGQLVALLFANNAIQNSNHINVTTNNVTRYSGLNVAAISRHGTVEFRHFNNPRDEAQMNHWINVCMSVRVAGVALVDMCATNGGVMRAVNADPSLVVQAVMANEILREACSAANITQENMQLEVDHLLAVTESLYPTSAASLAGLVPSLTPRELERTYGGATGILLTNGYMHNASFDRLITQISNAVVDAGTNLRNPASVVRGWCQDVLAAGWPALETSRTQVRRHWNSWIEDLDSDQIERLVNGIDEVLSKWEAQYDHQQMLASAQATQEDVVGSSIVAQQDGAAVELRMLASQVAEPVRSRPSLHDIFNAPVTPSTPRTGQRRSQSTGTAVYDRYVQHLEQERLARQQQAEQQSRSTASSPWVVTTSTSAASSGRSNASNIPRAAAEYSYGAADVDYPDEPEGDR